MRHFAARGAFRVDLRSETVSKILLVRPNFRLGNSVLALPSIELFRKAYPTARIDFLGSPVSQELCANLPLETHYQAARRFPKSAWAYVPLLCKLRRVQYDLAVEVSCSQSALGAFLVGLSGARVKVGSAGKWDFWYDVKAPKDDEINKYRVLPRFVAALGLQFCQAAPTLILSEAEIASANEALRAAGFDHGAAVLGVFVGGRKRHGKRWPADNFIRVIRNLTARGIPVAVFLGPEERDLARHVTERLRGHAPVICQPSLRAFAAILSRCRLFLSCDSGPMHLACAVGVRTIAIFQTKAFTRWGPPPESARIVYCPQGGSVEEVEAVCLAEYFELANLPPEKRLARAHDRAVT
jgi:heptosyltransferase-3